MANENCAGHDLKYRNRDQAGRGAQPPRLASAGQVIGEPGALSLIIEPRLVFRHFRERLEWRSTA
jgi:hypothetical protein